MRTQELYLLGQLVDLPVAGVGIPVQKEVLDYSQGSSIRKGDRTFDFTLPYSNSIKRVLGQRHDPQIVRKWNDSREFSARYYVDGLLIISGSFSIVSATSKEITLRIIGDNIAWVGQFSQRKLSEIKSLGSIAFIGSESQDPTVEPVDAITQPDVWALGENTEIQFPLVARGNFPAALLSSGESANRILQTEWQTFPPAVFVKPVIRAMFEDAGLKVIGSWIENDFLSSLHLPYVGQMQVPWNWGFLTRAKAERTVAYLYEVAVGSPLNTDFQFGPATNQAVSGWFGKADSEVHDYSRSYFLSAPDQVYICPVAGRYQVTVEMDISAMLKDLSYPFFFGTVNNDRICLAVVRVPSDSAELDALYADIGSYTTTAATTIVTDPNILAFFDFGTGYADGPMSGVIPDTTGTTYSQVFNGIPEGSPGSATTGSGLVKMVGSGNVAQADVLQVWLLNTTPGHGNILALQITADNYSVSVQEITLPERLAATAVVPDMPQIDLFQVMIRAFNLHWQVDNGLIRIESYNQFYKPSQTGLVLDSSLLPSENKPVPFAKVTSFEWALDPSDLLLQRHGQGKYGKTETAKSINYSSGNETISLSPFSATIDRKFVARNNITVSNDILIAPCMATEATLGVQQDIEWEYGFAPRLLRWIGMQPGRFVYAGLSKPEYPAARFAFSEGDGFGLQWADQDGTAILHDRGSMVNYLDSLGIYRYWAKLFAHRITSELVTVVVNISLKEFAQLDISQPVIIEGIAYTVYSLGSGFDPSKDTLIQMGLVRI